jgi:hypothetical protein
MIFLKYIKIKFYKQLLFINIKIIKKVRNNNNINYLLFFYKKNVIFNCKNIL